MAGERQLELDPQTKLLLTAKVTRLCEGGPEGFRQRQPFGDVREIVDTLDPIITPSSKVQIDTRNTKEQSTATGLADTGRGQMNYSFTEEKQSGFLLGVQEYRIGSYVVTKTEGSGLTLMTFTHYWERTLRDLEAQYENDPPINIRYATADRQLIGISHSVSVPFLSIGRLHLIRRQDEYWWKRENPTNKALEQAKKALLFSFYST